MTITISIPVQIYRVLLLLPQVVLVKCPSVFSAKPNKSYTISPQLGKVLISTVPVNKKLNVAGLGQLEIPTALAGYTIGLYFGDSTNNQSLPIFPGGKLIVSAFFEINIWNDSGPVTTLPKPLKVSLKLPDKYQDGTFPNPETGNPPPAM